MTLVIPKNWKKEDYINAINIHTSESKKLLYNSQYKESLQMLVVACHITEQLSIKERKEIRKNKANNIIKSYRKPIKNSHENVKQIVGNDSPFNVGEK